MSLIQSLRNLWPGAGADAPVPQDFIAREWSEAERMEAGILDDAINRSVLIVRPAEPFKRWAAQVEQASFAKIRHTLTPEELELLKPAQDGQGEHPDHTAYLIPTRDSLEIDPKLLKAIYLPIFERELFTACTGKEQWPKPRTLAMFREWFHLELCTLAIDLGAGDIERGGDLFE